MFHTDFVLLKPHTGEKDNSRKQVFNSREHKTWYLYRLNYQEKFEPMYTKFFHEIPPTFLSRVGCIYYIYITDGRTLDK